MTLRPSVSDFFVRLRKIDNNGLKCRDIVVLYAIWVQPGMMGLEVAKKLGYASRSHIQDSLKRLEMGGHIVDRRPTTGNLQMTPNNFHILPAGIALIADIVPN